MYGIISDEIWQIKPLLLWVLPRSEVNAVEVYLELNIFGQLFIQGWGKPQAQVDGHVEARLHQYPKNILFYEPWRVLHGSKGGKLCSLW